MFVFFMSDLVFVCVNYVTKCLLGCMSDLVCL